MRAPLLAVLGVFLSSMATAQTPVAAAKWGPGPPFFPAGARFVVLSGDPSQAGPYTVRLEMPAGYVIPPHSHPTDENVTVIQGNVVLGMGDTV
jgi:quercetin dioxygenase-like cupin family protein